LSREACIDSFEGVQHIKIEGDGVPPFTEVRYADIAHIWNFAQDHCY